MIQTAPARNAAVTNARDRGAMSANSTTLGRFGTAVRRWYLALDAYTVWAYTPPGDQPRWNHRR